MIALDRQAPLRAVQIALHDHLLGRATDIADHVVDGPHLARAERLHVYHHAYRARLQEALRDSFEKTWSYLGDARFAAAATAYIEHHPPQHRNLRWYGASFADWLAAHFPHDADIAELAMIDWQLRCAFDGENATSIAPDALACLPAKAWATVGVRFVPTMTVAPLRFNTVGIWHALDRDEPPPAAQPLAEPSWLLVWRRGWQPHFRTLRAEESTVLMQLAAGASLAQACLALPAADAASAAATSAHYLHTWLGDELVAGLTGAT